MAVHGEVQRSAAAARGGLAAASDRTLLQVRQNLLDGLDRVAESIDNGTFDRVGRGGQAPPRESGGLTLALLRAVDRRLGNLGYDRVLGEEEL